MLEITGFAIIKTTDKYLLSYTLSEKDANGRVLRNNIRRSCQVPENLMTSVAEIEQFIKVDISK